MKLFDPQKYWERRYRNGRTSGADSEGEAAKRKGEYVSKVLGDLGIRTAVDWGCGDGTVLSHIQTGSLEQYTGVDVSPCVLAKTAVEQASAERRFIHTSEYQPSGEYAAELGLSMDVLFHFPDDSDYTEYLDQLFQTAERYVLIYATNYDGGQTARHVRRRVFTADVAERHPEWKLVGLAEGATPESAGFYLYERQKV